MIYEIEFLKALSTSILIEAIIIIFLIKVVFKEQKYSSFTLAMVGVIPTMATLPYLWFVFPMFLKTKMSYIIACETSAIGVETFIIKGLLSTTLKKAFIFSFVANSISFLIGLMLF